MSTEHQQYSIENQSAAIALYAAAQNIAVVRDFVDHGKTGTTIKGRKGLQDLLAVIQSGAADFDVVLVYDVSRWGRFQDADEAAHYEFLCKRAGITVRYCAEQFENDNSPTSNLLKAFKRTMAGEYSRELSVKIAVGQRRLASMGYWQGGYSPFGYQRQILSPDGTRKEVLKYRQWKSVSTDRVTLTPGPPEQVETVKLAFDLYTKKRKNRKEIAEILNRRGVLLGRRPWTMQMLQKFLTEPVYRGAYAYGRYRNARLQPQDTWTVMEHTFPAIVSEKQWNRASELIAEEVKPLEDGEMLSALERLWLKAGKLNTKLINADKTIPSAMAYKYHFGSLTEAYKRIDYPFVKQYSFLHPIRLVRKMRDELADEICARIRGIGGTAERAPGPGWLLINGNITVKLTFSTGCSWRVPGRVIWTLVLGKRLNCDVMIVARLRPPRESIFDYFVIPACSQLHGGLHVHVENNAGFLDLYRRKNLDDFIGAFRRKPLLEDAG